MINLIRMEWYKLRTSKLFLILLAVVFGVNTISAVAVPLVTKLFAQKMMPVNFSDAISGPFILGLLMLIVFISAVSFLYTDFSGGYVKNIAGQLSDRGSLVIAKFIVIAVHNLIFFITGALSGLLGAAVTGALVLDAAAFSGVLTLLLKWLLSLALCSILMFFAVGLRHKSFAIIMAVLFATNTLNLIYMGINAAVMNIFKIESFSIDEFMPDALMGSVNVASDTLIINAIAVAAVFIGLFVTLTYITFKKRDVK